VELHDLYSSPNIIWVIRSRIMRCRHKWEDNIKMYLQVIGFGQGGCIDWIDQSQVRVSWQALVSAVMNFLMFHKIWEFMDCLRNC
jgi:hypothetical protein